MKIDLTELLQKVGNEADIEQTEEVTFPEDNLALTTPVKISVHLVNTGTSALMMGNASTEVALECSRCLNKFKYPISLKIEEEFIREPVITKGKKELKLGAEDFAFPMEKDNTIDLTELIRQEISLALPIKTLCSRDCKGIGGK